MHESLNAVFYILTFVLTAMTRTSAKYAASVGRYPYVASIQHRYLEEYCTGAIVTESHVLSAFSCACSYNNDSSTELADSWICHEPDSFIVVAGVAGKYMDFSSGSVRRIERFITTNDSFYPPNSTHFADIAIIVLKDPFVFRLSLQRMNVFQKWEKDRIKAAIIKGASNQQIHHNCSTVGWDFITGSERVSALTVLPTQIECKCNFDYCDQNQNTSYCVPYCEQPNICGTFRTGETRYCDGLKGNLLVCYGMVVGLVTVPANCSDLRKKVPTVFVRMDEMLELLYQILETSSSLTLSVGLATYFITLPVIIIFYDYTYYWYVNKLQASSYYKNRIGIAAAIGMVLYNRNWFAFPYLPIFPYFYPFSPHTPHCQTILSKQIQKTISRI